MTLQIVSADLATVLFDLDDDTGANNAGDGASVRTWLEHNPNWNAPAREFTRFNPPQRDGGSTVYTKAGLTDCTIPVHIQATSTDNLRQAFGYLSRLLAAGCPMKWVPNGATRTDYIDIEPSSTPALVGGQQTNLFFLFDQWMTPSGEFVLGLTRQPFFRGPELDSATNILTNSTLLIDAARDGTPDNWVWDSTTNITAQNIDATAQAFEFTIATTGTRNLQQTTANSTVTAASNYITAVYAKASAGSIARLTVGFQGKNNAGTNQGAESTSTQTTLTTAWQRVAISAAAAASSTKTQISLRFANAAATSVDVQMRFVQCKQEATITPFWVGNEAGSADVSLYGGRRFPIWNPGDAPMPLNTFLANSTSPLAFRWGLAADIVGLTDYLNGGYSQIEDWTEQTDTSATEDTSAGSSPGSGDTGLATTFATTTYLTRADTTISDAAFLRWLSAGTWRVYVRIIPFTNTYTGAVGLNWGFGSSTAYVANNSVAVTALSTSNYYELDLGIMYPPTRPVTSVYLALLASRTAGSGNLIWDHLVMVPAETEAGLQTSSGMTSSRYLVTYPEDSVMTQVDSSGNEISIGPNGVPSLVAATGPVPFASVPPGLSIVYAYPSSNGSLAAPGQISIRTQTSTFKATGSPRFYG